MEDRLVVKNKQKEWELKTGESHGNLLEKDGSNGEEKNDRINNGIGDKYKHGRQQLTLSPRLFERNLYQDERHEGITSCIVFITGSKGQDCDKS